MKAVYRGRGSSRSNIEPTDRGDVIELLHNTWDDFGNKTTFETVARINGQIIELGAIRLLVEGETNTARYLKRMLDDGWDGEFPLPDADYVSVPSDITFYEQIVGAADRLTASDIARALNDASLLVHAGDETALRLAGSDPFKESLLRENGSSKAFEDGWHIFSRQNVSVLDLGFRFRDVCSDISTLNLKFEPAGPLPTDINVLIGPNGVGKSRILHQIVRHWTTDRPLRPETGFVKRPNLSQIIVVSYSPFEKFPVDLENKKLRDKDIYRYFGLRARHSDDAGIRLSRDEPERAAASSLLDCAAGDLRFAAIENWANKIATAEEVLRDAIGFDDMAVRVRRRQAARYVQRNVDEAILDDEDARYVKISSDNLRNLRIDEIRTDLMPRDGVLFIKDGVPKALSSGQKLFSWVVLNILGALRRDSLILIDEPELFLHPKLEIDFIGMLKKILSKFNSKALLSTHSEVTVREVPSACVHVMERTDDGLSISRPPFQTFGGDIQRISSYVFRDNDVSKPFEKWIREKLTEYGGADALLATLGDDANEELTVQIRAVAALARRRAPR